MSTEDHDTSLESMLRTMPLRKPTLQLDARVAEVFAQSQSRRMSRLKLYGYAAVATALLVIGISIRLPHRTSSREPLPISTIADSNRSPVHIERDFSRDFDEGTISSTDDSAYQKYNRRTVREIWTIDPKTHSRSVVSIPSDHLLIEKLVCY